MTFEFTVNEDMITLSDHLCSNQFVVSDQVRQHLEDIIEEKDFATKVVLKVKDYLGDDIDELAYSAHVSFGCKESIKIGKLFGNIEFMVTEDEEIYPLDRHQLSGNTFGLMNDPAAWRFVF